jgi:hypothetical protein
MSNVKMKIAYVITERNGRSYWNRVGVGFVNSDGSINLRLEAVPVSGEMQIRDHVPREDGLSSSARSSNGHGTSESYAELA